MKIITITNQVLHKDIKEPLKQFTCYSLLIASAIGFIALSLHFKVTEYAALMDASAIKPVIHEAKAAPEAPKPSIETYICQKFGDACKMALAISQAENGTRQCDRVNINKDKSLDIGIFQINTVHLKKGWKLPELTDCYTNVDKAYEIYKAQGWTPWVTYQTQAYKRFLQS